MGEYFEITFLEENRGAVPSASEKIKSVLHVKDGRNAIGLSEIPLLKNQSVYFQSIVYPKFTMHQLSIEDFVLKKQTFELQLDQLMQAISICFASSPALTFATGIYELTGYYLGDSEDAEDAVERAFRRFPMLFFRETSQYSKRAAAIVRYHIACIVQSSPKIQNFITD